MSQDFSMHDLSKIAENLPAGEVILDVRTPEEYAEGHIKGSINIPHDEVSDHLEKIKSYKKVYMHCRSGQRVKVAMAAFNAAGLGNVVCISNSGMLEWFESGYPIEK